MALSPTATTISVQQTLDVLDGPFQAVAMGVCQGPGLEIEESDAQVDWMLEKAIRLQRQREVAAD